MSRPQYKTLEMAFQHGEPVAISAITLLEISILVGEGKLRIKGDLKDLFERVESSPGFRIYPLTCSIAVEAGAFQILKDPADRTIVATARIHGFRLVTSDQRIIASKLTPVLD